jgi:ketopantoate reductase
MWIGILGAGAVTSTLGRRAWANTGHQVALAMRPLIGI